MKMKKNKTKSMKWLVVFVIVAIILLLILNVIYAKYVLTKKNFYRKELAYQDYTSNHTEIKYAFFGDSHTFHAIHPKYIPWAFNFGSGTQNYIKTYYLLDRVVNKDDIEVDSIVLQIDLHTFSSWLTEEPFLFNELELYSQFVPLIEVKEIRKNSSLFSLFIEAKLPIVGKGKEFGIFILPIELSEMYEGWIKNPKDFSEYNETERLKIAYEGYKVHFEGKERINALSMEYFLKTLKLAKQKGINVIFIKYPMSEEYDEVTKEYNITKDDYYPTIFNETESILGEDYYVLDYSSIFLENPEYLGDTYHVNYKGAEIISEQIYSDLISLNLTAEKTINPIKLYPNKNTKISKQYLLFYFLIITLIIVFALIRITRCINKKINKTFKTLSN